MNRSGVNNCSMSQKIEKNINILHDYYSYKTNKNLFRKNYMQCRLMIDRDIAEKNYENKVGMSSY